MQRRILVAACAALLAAAGSGALLADEDDVRNRCMTEAQEDGITDPEELADYVQQCVADLSGGESEAPPDE